MAPLKRICCAVDGSAASRAALARAADLARRDGAALHLVHVRAGWDVSGAPFAPPRSLRREHGEGWDLSRWIAELGGTVPGLVAVERTGDPSAAILAYADERDCDLVVLGTPPPRRGLRRLAFASVAEQVVRGATRAVLVVPPPGPGAAAVGAHEGLRGDPPGGPEQGAVAPRGG